MDEASAPLNTCRVLTKNLVINRLHIFLNGIAILSVFYYRATTFFQTEFTPLLLLLLYTFVVIAEIVLTFLWVLHQATRWRPVKRTVYTERLPEEEELPPVDVFVCTADPTKEPPLGVMNTVISALSLDYPPHKLAVYLSDDGGSHVTLHAVREAWSFAGFWVPFCRKYGLKCRCPEAYFSAKETVDDVEFGEFVAEKKIIEKKYCEFREALEKNSVNASASVSRDHSATIEVMRDGNRNSVPILVYVAREKRPTHPHHFKGGALNVLLRVSAVMSNAPYFLVLDCDMYCDDPSSARQAMCFYLDPKLSPQIGWVQFPQKFHNINKHDVYGGSLHHIWREGLGLDGLRGPTIYGCNFYMRREAIYGTQKIQKDIDLNRLRKSFGSSNEFIKSIYRNYEPQLGEDRNPSVVLQKELQLLASCAYDIGTEWGEKASFYVGYRYFTVVEDTITSLELHCSGWISVLIDPARPCFLGASPTNLSDMLVQQTRWSFGLMQIGLSCFSPLVYGPLRMSTLQSMSYAAFILDCLYTLPFYTLGLLSPICLFYNIPLYPKASEPYFIAFAYIFLSSQLKHVQEVISYGDSLTTALYELRVWMMKSGTCYIFGLIDAILDRIGLHEANFTLTNKVVDDEQARRHEMGVYDFQASTWLLAPLCSVYILNLVSIIIGGARICQQHHEFVAQLALSLFGVVVNYHLFEGMVLRKDSGRVPPFASWLAVVISTVFLCFGYLLLF
ncbi:hypothetical protein C2S52_014814 [Perilla frutescens var. hirtella]|nr:hypothetical protein C2S52_014814 [Perilla frutescens var. hirtella]